MTELSVVIPAFNEAERLAPTVRAIAAYCEARHPAHEIIVVDDGSTDRTVALAQELAEELACVRVVGLGQNRGKGAAVRAGVMASQGALVLFSDADLATPIEELEKLRRALDGGADVAIASRAAAGADIRVRQHPMRELMGRTFNLMVRALAIDGIKDTQCGFKLFRGDVARELFGTSKVDGFAFDVEVLWLARRAGHRVAEVPVVWRHVEESKVSPGSDAARMFVDLVRIRWLHRGGR